MKELLKMKDSLTENETINLLSFEQTDILKGIAILLVVVSHVGLQWTRFATPLDGIGVAIFLALSGYGLSKSYDRFGLKEYWRKRIIAVIVPYFIVELIMLPMNHETPLSFLLDITLIKPQFRLGWYLNYLLLWYVIFWCVKQLKMPPLNETIVFVLFSVALGIYFNFASPLRFEQSLSFLVGLIAARYDMRKYICKKNCMLLLLTAVFVLGIKQTKYVRNWPSTGLNVVDLIIKSSALVAVMMFVYLFQNWNGWKIFIPVGKVSYELYLVHGYALQFFYMSFSKGKALLLFLITSIIVTIALYYFDYFLKHFLKSKMLTTVKNPENS